MPLVARVAPGLDGLAVGGGSDGNFTAAIGVPTLDGLGAVGGGAHADHEYVLVDTMPERAALIAGLVRHDPRTSDERAARGSGPSLIARVGISPSGGRVPG